MKKLGDILIIFGACLIVKGLYFKKGPEIVPPPVSSFGYAYHKVPLFTQYSLLLPSPSKKIVIAVVDTGVDWSHPMLSPFQSPRMRSSYEEGFDLPHGTHVAGIIANQLHHIFGRRASEFFTIESFRYSEEESYLDAVFRAVESHPDIINLSVNGLYPMEIERDILKIAHDHGIKIIASAGNLGINSPTYPCAYDFVECVENIQVNGRLNRSSNYGDFIKYQAPGTDILSSFPYGRLGFMTGTSQSAPFVTALKASIMVNPRSIKEFSFVKQKQSSPSVSILDRRVSNQ